MIATATLKVVCGLSPAMTIHDALLRSPTTLQVDGAGSTAAAAEVPAFWEDQLFSAEERTAVRFRIGEVNFEGSNPCARCPVPPRDPHTGVIIPGFQKIFSDYRRSHIPACCPEPRFHHYYRLPPYTP